MIHAQRLNVATRNTITLGLIQALVDSPGVGAITPDMLTGLTIRGIYDYLRAINPANEFHVSMWRPRRARKLVVGLDQIMTYPEKDRRSDGAVPRMRNISLNEHRYQLVKTWRGMKPIVTPCVSEARIAGGWVDFDGGQTVSRRGLQSAIQVPVFWEKNRDGEREMLGVLSVDTDKPDFFQIKEEPVWVEEFSGFLANLALAEHMNRARGVARPFS
jgi:hypothetical protein